MRTIRQKRLSDSSFTEILRWDLGQLLMIAATRSAIRHRWLVAATAIAFVVLIPYFAAGDPPGVDSPSFLHFGWVFQQSLTGAEGSSLTDRWWYGGLPYLQAYSPGGYGAVGLLGAITPFAVAGAFKIVMAVAVISTTATTYWLGRTLGLTPIFSFLAAALLVLSYPVIAGVGIFGWLPTLASMPFAMAAYIAVEKWTSKQTRRKLLYAGALLGLALIAHHMTAIAFGLAIAVRLTVFSIDHPSEVRSTTRAIGTIAVTTAVVSAWWAIPFLVNTISVGFQRELAGNWEFEAATFASSVFDRTKIGIETFPSYIGFVQGGLGIAGAVYAFVYRSRLRGLAVVATVLFWFSTGTSLNPLVRVYPLSGLDVSRFAFYVAPMFALLAASLVQQFSRHKRLATFSAAPAVLTVVMLLVPVVDALAARDVLRPVEEPQIVSDSIAWIEQNVPADETVLAVGYRNWDGYWIPGRAGVPIMDGWYDEGAKNWRNVRAYRLMGWLGEVDAAELHGIMGREATRYLVITDWDTTDSPHLFEEAVSSSHDLFKLEATLEGTTVYTTR